MCVWGGDPPSTRTPHPVDAVNKRTMTAAATTVSATDPANLSPSSPIPAAGPVARLLCIPYRCGRRRLDRKHFAALH